MELTHRNKNYWGLIDLSITDDMCRVHVVHTTNHMWQRGVFPANDNALTNRVSMLLQKGAFNDIATILYSPANDKRFVDTQTSMRLIYRVLQQPNAESLFYAYINSGKLTFSGDVTLSSIRKLYEWENNNPRSAVLMAVDEISRSGKDGNILYAFIRNVYVEPDDLKTLLMNLGGYILDTSSDSDDFQSTYDTVLHLVRKAADRLSKAQRDEVKQHLEGFEGYIAARSEDKKKQQLWKELKSVWTDTDTDTVDACDQCGQQATHRQVSAPYYKVCSNICFDKLRGK